MNRDYNSQGFTPKQIEQGLFQDQLDTLLRFNRESEDSYYDIHITSDGYCTILEWVEMSYKDCCIGRFEFVGCDQSVLTEYTMPDGTINLCYDEEEYREQLKEFLEDEANKGRHWKQSEFSNHWYVEEEQEEFRKELEESKGD